jgi:hypothetical protein
MVDKALPFYAVWQAVIPGIKTALKTLHGIWEPSTRESLSTGGTVRIRMCAHPNMSDTDVRLVGMPFQHNFIVLFMNFNMFICCN